MNGREHILAGIITATAMIDPQALTVGTIMIYPIAIMGSLLPDIDLDNSTISKVRPMRFLHTLWAGKDEEHRGITHTIRYMLTVSLIIWMLMWPLHIDNFFYIEVFINAILSHLLLDLVTGKIPMPFNKKKKIGIKLIDPTNKYIPKIEQIILVAVIIYQVYGIVAYNVMTRITPMLHLY